MGEHSDTIKFLKVILKKEGGLSESKAHELSVQFATLSAFYEADFENIKLVRGGDHTEIALNDKDRAAAQRVKKYIHPEATLKEHWIRFTAERLIRKMMDNIRAIDLEKINMNPFLIRALNLRTPQEIIRFNMYQTVTRSIVTTMGMSLEYMVGSSGARMGERGEWYDVVKEMGDLTYWIQVKSGPNNVNKDQIETFNDRFDQTEAEDNNFARLGITYGKRDAKTVSMGLVKKYMKNWKERLLVGHELWDFVSEEENYHVKVLRWIDDTASRILRTRSIAQEIDKAIEQITAEFEQKYGTGERGVEKYLNSAL